MPSSPSATPGLAVDTDDAARQALRRRLVAEREHFAAGPDAPAAQAALAAHLGRLLSEIEPEQLGIYWPVRGEFNPIAALDAAALPKLPLALPFAQRRPPAMHYRAWDGQAPGSVDECGLPAPSAGLAVVPDVVLVPCVGYTASGFRLGYGGGYFDRWLADHPQVTAIGLAWAIGEIGEDAFAPQAHDQKLMLVLTERGVAA
jgi:5,10-methenyltetrahydrofolate synthetase